MKIRSTHLTFTCAVVGLVLGAGWGVAARAWMRLISTEPEFSWSGTFLIITIAAAGGLGMGLVGGARASGRRRWWRLAALLAFPVVVSPQGVMVFLPAFVLGGLALSDRSSLWLRTSFVAVTGAMPILMWFVLLSPSDRPGGRFSTFVGGLVLLCLGLAYGGSQLFRRWHKSETSRPQLVEASAAHVGHAAGSAMRM